MRLSALALLALAPAALPAQWKIMPPAQQIALAVQALPQEFRADATVLGYNAAGKLVTLRQGKGAMICLAQDPQEKGFHVACYQKDLEPFMKRGRELREQGVTGGQVDSVRFAEVKSGKLTMPKAGALWQLFGPATAVDLATNTVSNEAKPLYVIYMPYATPESTGIPAKPSGSMPWLMLPGTVKAHVMFTPNM